MRRPSRRPSRRTVVAGLGGLGVAGAGLIALRMATPALLRPGPVRRREELSDDAQEMIAGAFVDVDPTKLWDLHVHLVGIGSGGSGCWVNPAMRSHWHPVRRLQFDAYLAASGVRDPDRADRQFVERLLSLHRAANPAGKLVLLAFDYHVDERGQVVKEASPFHTPDDYALALAAEHEDLLACASIHPYRSDAVERLERAVEGGAVAVKWLPNAMGIDPSSERCDAFYARLRELSVPLLTHTGIEKAVHAEEDQELGNPLFLRRPLEAGVRVLAAHCATLGESVDLDAGDGSRVPSFDLFLRLVRDERFQENLFGEISALTLVNRAARPLRELLLEEDLHPRLVNGSDYPLPAIDPLVSTRWLAYQGFLDEDERPALNEIFEANPLLFDYVLKRRLAVEEAGRTHRFRPRLFETARIFG